MVKKIKSGDEAIYHCVYGFVAGLPQECSLQQALELGMEKELQAAIDSGTYILGPAPLPQNTINGEPEDKE